MGAVLPDVKTLVQAGINPKNGLPIKMTSGNPSHLKEDILQVIRTIDEQDAVRRYKWYNLPDGIDGELIERMLYYRGQLAFFYMKTLGKFFILPYALAGTIDVYGRYTAITPLPFNGTSDNGGKDKIKPWIEDLIFEPIYEIKYDEVKPEDLEKKCVLLHDYAKGISQTIIPRQILNDPICKVEAECIPFMRTALILGTGIKGVRVTDADTQKQTEDAAKSIEEAALTGKPWVSIIAPMDLQELTDASILKGADYMQSMQSIDNFRLGTYGIDNGGLFEKKSHMLEQEAAINGGSVSLSYQDGLTERQDWCDKVNSLWGLGVWCEPSEAVMGGDVNRDGVGYDINPVQGQSTGGENNGDDTSI